MVLSDTDFWGSYRRSRLMVDFMGTILTDIPDYLVLISPARILYGEERLRLEPPLQLQPPSLPLNPGTEMRVVREEP